jgi:hypothetical protein
MPNGKRKERGKRAALNTRGGGIAEMQGKERLLLLAAKATGPIVCGSSARYSEASGPFP